MKVIDEALLATFRTPGACEVCGKGCRRREGHHIVTRGAGGSDLCLNLVAVGRSQPFPECPCHSGFEWCALRGQRSSVESIILGCREVIAARESTTPERIEELVMQVRRDSRKTWDVSKQGPAIGKCELCGEWKMIEEIEDGLCNSCQEQIQWEETQ